MRTIPSALQAKLDSGVTTLCSCWIIPPSDGVTQGFTDHDEDVVLGEVTCRASGVARVAKRRKSLDLLLIVPRFPAHLRRYT